MHNDKLNDHTDKIACQTCHIPTIARGGYATKIRWDWSSSGRLGADGKPILKKDAKGNVVYSTQKGDSVWAENLMPDYIWFNGDAKYTLLGNKIDPGKTVPINTFLGTANGPNSRIWPVKKTRSKQPYDAGNNTLVAVNLFAVHRFAKDKDGYWRNLNWKRAIAKGMKAAGRDFSGKVGFVETEMLWPVTHMVAPAKKALGCTDCHSKNGRLNDVKGIYIPGRDRNPLVEWLGWVMLLATLAAVLLHGLVRIVTRNRRSVKP